MYDYKKGDPQIGQIRQISEELTQRRKGAKSAKIENAYFLCVLCFFAPLRELL
jgi:hypothetical protein